MLMFFHEVSTFVNEAIKILCTTSSFDLTCPLSQIVSQKDEIELNEIRCYSPEERLLVKHNLRIKAFK